MLFVSKLVSKSVSKDFYSSNIYLQNSFLINHEKFNIVYQQQRENTHKNTVLMILLLVSITGLGQVSYRVGIELSSSLTQPILIVESSQQRTAKGKTEQLSKAF